MGKFTELLKTMRPRNGRLITEDGEAWNRADRGSFNERYDVQYQTVQNGASRLSASRRGIDQEIYWIGIDVPAGRRLVLWEDALKLSENEYDVDIFEAPDGFTGGEQGIKSELGTSGSGTVQSVLWFNVTPTDEETHAPRLEDYTDAGAVAGPGRPTVTPAGDETFQIIDTPLLIRLTRIGTGQAYTVSYRAVVWEQEVHDG